MARKKKTEPLIGMTRDPENKLTVQKSQPLTWLWQSDLSLAEFKILDAYLARINSSKPSQRSVVLQKGELESALGVTRINNDDLKLRLKHLSQPIDLAKGNKKKIHIIGLFEEAEAEQDEDGIWQIKLTCTEAATKYIFNVEKLGYLRYKLRCITSLTSRYTYILFIYLEANRFRESWEIDLDELKQILNCHEDSLYDEYKRFNERILKRCQKELSEKTECRFTYEPVRRGRSVAAIHFKLEMLSPRLEAEIQGKDPDQMSLFDYEDEDDERVDLVLENRDRRDDEIGAGFGHAIFDEFTDEELTELKELAFSCADPDRVTVHAKYCERLEAISRATAEFIEQKIKAMNVYDRRTPIKDRYSYLKKSIVKEKKEQ